MTNEPFIPTPEMIAAAWDAWMPRHKQHTRMGLGPAFREAIQAALAKMPNVSRPPTPTPQNHGGNDGA